MERGHARHPTSELKLKPPSIYNSCLSHSTSLARALPRCEILFFSTFGISAYVWPSYSKQASQPGRNKIVSLRIRYLRVMHKASYRNQSAHEPQQLNPRIKQISKLATDTKMSPEKQTYRCPSLENDRLMAGTFAVSESADGLGGLVFEAGEELVELLDAEGLKEPFSAR
jgi:hypothetical protein